MNEIQKYRAVVLIDLAVLFLLWVLTYVLDRLGLFSELYGYVVYALTGLTALSYCYALLRYCRCPHCKKHLPFRGALTIKYCPECGKLLLGEGTEAPPDETENPRAG